MVSRKSKNDKAFLLSVLINHIKYYLVLFYFLELAYFATIIDN